MADTSPDISKHDSSSDSEAWARFTRYDSDADTDTDSAPENGERHFFVSVSKVKARSI